MPDGEPNFITQKGCTAAIFDISRNTEEQDIKGKIVMIRSADPGFDRIFSRDIAGFITAYGGANSHMAIRAAVENFLIELAVIRDIPLNYFGTKLGKVDGHIRTEHTLTSGKKVNSFHGFGAKTSPECIKIIEKSEDGVIEEFTHVRHENIYGIMWHPERYHPFRDEDPEFIRRKLKL